jgi:hypothetical protein
LGKKKKKKKKKLQMTCFAVAFFSPVSQSIQDCCTSRSRHNAKAEEEYCRQEEGQAKTVGEDCGANNSCGSEGGGPSTRPASGQEDNREKRWEEDGAGYDGANSQEANHDRHRLPTNDTVSAEVQPRAHGHLPALRQLCCRPRR